MKESRHVNFGAIHAIFLQLSWSQHKLAHSCQGRGQRSNGAINRNKHFARRFCRGISNLVTSSLTVAELFQKEIWEAKKETMREGGHLSATSLDRVSVSVLYTERWEHRAAMRLTT